MAGGLVLDITGCQYRWECQKKKVLFLPHWITIIPHGFESDLVFENTNSRDFLWAYALITLRISNYSSYLHPYKVCLKTNHWTPELGRRRHKDEKHANYV